MKNYAQAQEWYDGMLPPEHDDAREEARRELVDEKEKEIFDDAADFGDRAVDAIVEYLSSEDGVPDNIMLGFKRILSNVVTASFRHQRTPLVAFVYAAIKWKAEQIADEEMR